MCLYVCARVCTKACVQSVCVCVLALGGDEFRLAATFCPDVSLLDFLTDVGVKL